MAIRIILIMSLAIMRIVNLTTKLTMTFSIAFYTDPYEPDLTKHGIYRPAFLQEFLLNSIWFM